MARPTRGGRRVAAFIVGAAYLAREIIKARYRVYCIRIHRSAAIPLCISTHVWDFQRATTVCVIDRVRPTRRSDHSDHSPNRLRRPPSRSTSRPTMNALMHFLFDHKRGRRRGRRRGRVCTDLYPRSCGDCFQITKVTFIFGKAFLYTYKLYWHFSICSLTEYF